MGGDGGRWREESEDRANGGRRGGATGGIVDTIRFEPLKTHVCEIPPLQSWSQKERRERENRFFFREVGSGENEKTQKKEKQKLSRRICAEDGV